MTDRTGPDAAASTLADPAQRGHTTIAGGVVERIARLAATDVPGVEPAGSGLDKVVGRQYPKVNADVAGSRARLAVEIAVVWPYPLADVCAEVRDHIAARLSELTGLSIDTVDVTAAAVVPAQTPNPKRVQ